MVRVVVGGTVKDRYMVTQREGPFLLNEKYELTQVLTEFLGGAGANISITLAGFGSDDVYVHTKLGDDDKAREILTAYHNSGVHTAYVKIDTTVPTGRSYVVLNEQTKQRMIFVKRMTLTEADIDEALLEKTAAQWLYMSSVGPAAQKVLRMAADHPGVSLTVIFGSKEIQQLKDGVLTLPDGLGDRPYAILVLNKEEWEQLDALHGKLQAAFSELVVTDGADGIRIDCDAQGERIDAPLDRWMHIPAYTVPAESIQDTTGAGDLTTTSYSYARSLGATRVQSARFAAVVASMGIQAMGAHEGAARAGKIENLQDVEAFLQKWYTGL